jgi:hypothetical protein
MRAPIEIDQNMLLERIGGGGFLEFAGNADSLIDRGVLPHVQSTTVMFYPTQAFGIGSQPSA